MAWLGRLLLVVCFVGTAHADGRRDEARAHHTLAKIEFDHGRFAEALSEFKRAYELAPVPELLFNMARCQEQLGDRRAAIASYEQYVAAKPDAPDRAEVETHIEALRRDLPPEPAAVTAPVTPVLVTPAPVTPVPVTPSLVVQRPPPSRRGLWIGLGVGLGVVVVTGVVVLGVLATRPDTSQPYGGNFNPPFTQINP